MHLVQLSGPAGRRVALVEEPSLRFLKSADSVYELAQQAILQQTSLAALVQQSVSDQRIPYDPVYNGSSEWSLLPPIDIPGDPHRVLVAGTGLTHYGSA